MLLLLTLVAGDPWSLGRRDVTESDAVGMTLSYFESLIAGKPTVDVHAALKKSRDPQRLGCLALTLLLGPDGDDRLAAATAVDGFLTEPGCTLCKSLVAFLAGEGFWRGYGDLSGSAEMLRRLPELADPQADFENAAVLYREALTTGATDPLTLLGLLTTSQSQGVDVCSELLTQVSLLADRSLENCVSSFPKPTFVENLNNVDDFGFAHALEREEELWLLLHSGEIAIPDDQEFRREMAQQAADVLKELETRDPDAHSSRVAQALESYMSDDGETDSTTQLRNMLELIKRNHVVARYNKAINKHGCNASIRSLNRLIYENNRFARLLHSLFVWHWGKGEKMKAYWSSLMLGRMGSASGLLNAALMAENLDPVKVEVASKPLDFLRLHAPLVEGMTCPVEALIEKLEIEDETVESICETTCIASEECMHVVFVPLDESASKCSLFRSCKALVPADDDEAVVFHKVVATREEQQTCWLLRGACASKLYESAASLTDSIVAYTWLSRHAWDHGDRKQSYTWSVLAARKGSEEARLNLALSERYDWPGHKGNELNAIQMLWGLVTEDEPLGRQASSDPFNMDLDVAMLSGSELGQQILELLDMESSSNPSTFPRRMAAFACFVYYSWIHQVGSFTPDLSIHWPILVSLVAVVASTVLWWFRSHR